MYSVRMCMKYTSTRTTTRVVRVSSVHSPDCTCIHTYAVASSTLVMLLQETAVCVHIAAGKH